MVNLNTTQNGLWGRTPADRQALVLSIIEKHGLVVTRKQVLAVAQSMGKTNADVRFLFNNKAFRAGRGQYTLQPFVADTASVSAASAVN